MKLLAMIVIAATGAVTWYQVSGEPTYKGSSLTTWIKKGYFTVNHPMAYPRVAIWPEEAEANEAVRKMGTNAVPSLLTMLQAKGDSRLKLKILTWLQSHHANSGFLGMDVTLRRSCGSVGLSILGADAEAAIPAIKSLLEHGDWYQQQEAARVLSNMGPVGIRPLRDILANPNSKGRPMAACFLRYYADEAILLSRDKVKSQGEIDQDAEVIVPELIKYIGDRDQDVRMWAIDGLGRFARKSEIAVPALVHVLIDTNQTSRIRGCAATALGNFRQDAAQAVPALERVAAEGDSTVRMQAIPALESINAALDR
jgi:HEAT repeat protein